MIQKLVRITTLLLVTFAFSAGNTPRQKLNTYEQRLNSFLQDIDQNETDRTPQRINILAENISRQSIKSTILNSPRIQSQVHSLIAYTNLQSFLNENNATTLARQNLAYALQNNGIALDLTPSQALLIVQGNDVKPYLQQKIIDNTQLLESFNLMLRQEKSILKNGNFVVYHGCQKDRYATMYLHTKLHEKFQKKTDCYLHLRQPRPIYTPEKSGAEIRKHYLKNGGKWLNIQSQYHLLFCNNALSANLYGRLVYDESALNFFIAKNQVFDAWKRFVSFMWETFSRKSSDIDLEPLFAQYNATEWYLKNKENIATALQNELENNVMLQCELSEEALRNASFASQPLGIPLQAVINNKEVSDPVIIFDTLCNRPFAIQDPHLMLWCLILTDDLLLNPDNETTQNGFKISPFSMQQDKLNALHERIDQLVSSITADA